MYENAKNARTFFGVWRLIALGCRNVENGTSCPGVGENEERLTCWL
jgi:hypothetical protein